MDWKSVLVSRYVAVLGIAMNDIASVVEG